MPKELLSSVPAAMTQQLPAFLLPSIVKSSEPAFPLPQHKKSYTFVAKASTPSSTSASTSPTSPHPPISVGLNSKPGLTGTLCANLYPIPILGRYGWFLNVYRRSLPSQVGPYTVQIPADKSSVTLSFNANPELPAQKTFNGIPQGNLNVQRFITQLSATPADHQLRFYDVPTNETFFQRKNDLSLGPTPSVPPPWHDPTPLYAVVAQTSAFQVRALYPSAGAAPRRISKFEWFAMSLFPLFPLAAYSAFICVWRQIPDMASVAIDKLGSTLRLSWFDPLELPDASQAPEKYAVFAVKEFLGSVSDEVVAEQHHELVSAVRASTSTSPVSETDFRIVVDNRPSVLPQHRKNEIWVQIDENELR